ncbi:hypothetical protein ACIG5E_34365 [Kitasatospora sp. NPDC053057]|uniref:hypothetical protein n=1 Tax=Kitasatospora sp. NPDC053057 TaxID=3364062 RepID=UPI0037C90C4E
MARDVDEDLRPVSLRGLLPGAAAGRRHLVDWLRAPRLDVARAAATAGAGDEWTVRLSALNTATDVFFADYWAAARAA